MRAVKTYSQFINESLFSKKGKAAKGFAKRWVETHSEEERREIKREAMEAGVTSEEFTKAIGDAYDSQW
jgi:hypothetical protein